MKTLTLSAKTLRNLAAIEVGNHAVYAVDPEFGGGWKVEDCSTKEVGHFPLLEEALAFVESFLE